MRARGDIIIDRKRKLVYRVKDVRGAMLIIERVLPSSHALTSLDILEPFDRRTLGLISLF